MLPKKSESVSKHLENGSIKEKYLTKLHPEDIDSSISTPTLTDKRAGKLAEMREDAQFSTVEFLQQNKKMISKDKSNTPEKNIQNMKSSKTSVQGSIGNEKVLSPYWKELCVEKSKKLLSSTGIDSAVLDLSSLNLLSPSTMPDSWFPVAGFSKVPSKNSPKISWQSFMSSHADRWGKDDILKKSRKSLKIKIYPTSDQAKILRMWINDARLSYNKTVEELQNESDKHSKYTMRNRIVIKKNTTMTDPDLLESMERTPKDIRAKACFEATEAHNLSIAKTQIVNPRYKSYERLINIEEKKKAKNLLLLNRIEKLERDLESIKPTLKTYVNKANLIEKYKKQIVHVMDIEGLKKIFENIPRFMTKTSNVKFRKGSSQYSHIFIPKTAAKVGDNFIEVYTRSNIGQIRTDAPLREITADFQIRHDNRLNSWHIIVSEEVIPEKSVEINNIISIDPGIRTFLTGVDSDGNVLEIGKDWCNNSRIKERLKKLDKCKAMKMKNAKTREERYDVIKSKRNAILHQRKINNLINDMHKKASGLLLENYDLIVLPKLRTKTILKRENGLGKLINRKINIISHGKFHDYISWKAKMMGKIVVDQNEAFTTKTCYQCGFLNDIGSSKIYSCAHCGHQSDRDIQSSLNILTKFMGSYTSTGQWGDSDVNSINIGFTRL